MTQKRIHQFMSQAEHVASGCETSAVNHDCLRTSPRYRRDLAQVREILAFLREQAQASDSPFVMGATRYDAADLDELGDGLDRLDTHFWHLDQMGLDEWGNANA